MCVSGSSGFSVSDSAVSDSADSDRAGSGADAAALPSAARPAEGPPGDRCRTDGWRQHLARAGADGTTLAALESAAGAVAAAEPSRLVLPGRVARAEPTLATVLTAAGPVRAAVRRGTDVCAGDWVTVHPAAGPTPAELATVLPRRTKLVRHASGKVTAAQILAANVDEVFVTVAADRGLSLSRVERFLALAWDSGASPVVVLTKGDLLAPGAETGVLTTAMSAAPGAEVCLVSAHTGTGMDGLAARLGDGRTAALIGSSGAGKSSLLNALAGAEVAETSGVRGVDGKGRHTTAWRELIVLAGGGAVIDTPGLRGLGLWLDEGGLDAAFADVTELAEGCRFADCSHDTEPGCAVTAAIADGSLSARRLESYRKLEREAAWVARKSDARARREQAKVWAARTREVQGRIRQSSRYS